MEDRLRSMEEIRRNQDEELACLRQESAMKLKEAMIERRCLIERIERLSSGSMDSDLAIVSSQSQLSIHFLQCCGFFLKRSLATYLITYHFLICCIVQLVLV